VSTDEVFAQQLAARLQTAGVAVEHRAKLAGGEQATLCVLHVHDQRVPGEHLPACPLLIAVPTIDTATVVEMLHRSERVLGAQLADPDQLAIRALQLVDGTAPPFGGAAGGAQVPAGDGTAPPFGGAAGGAQVPAGDRTAPPFGGVAGGLPAGTQIAVMTVCDATDKDRCRARIGRAIDLLDLPRSRRAAIDQCLDEMLMNALYDAPVDARGRHVFEGIATRTRVRMRTSQQVTVEWASSGDHFTVAVRDAFGSLGRDVVVRHLDKALHADQVIERKAGGAGLGLFLIASAASGLAFHVTPGVCTEVVCMFSTHHTGLEHFSFCVHPPAGIPPTAPARRRLATRYRVRRAAAVALATSVAAAAVIAWPHVFPDLSAHVTFDVPAGTTIEVEGRLAAPGADGRPTIEDLVEDGTYRVSARRDGFEPARMIVRPHRGDNLVTLDLPALAVLDIESQPQGAMIEIEGRVAGTTPLHIVSLKPSATVSLQLALPGYRVTTTRVQVPPRGQTAHVAPRLERDDLLVRVHVFSQPIGATVLGVGEVASADRTFTPADVYVQPGVLQRFRLTMPKHADLDIEPFTAPRGGPALDKGGELEPAQ
jgi:hypothetical protein